MNDFSLVWICLISFWYINVLIHWKVRKQSVHYTADYDTLWQSNDFISTSFSYGKINEISRNASELCRQ